MRSADVIVVGGGVNGMSTAFHLAKAGAGKIIVVERRHVAAGASGKSGALVRMHYTNEPETRLARVSLDYFQNWSDLVGGDCGFKPIGLLVFVARDQRADLEANLAMQQEVGVDTRLISAADALEMDPSLYVDDVDVVAWEPGSGYADPNATTFGFARAAEQMGVELLLDTPVERILIDGDKVTGVQTATEQIAASTVVVAAGAWSNQLFDPIGIDLGLRPIPARVAVFRWAYDRSPSHLTYIDHINGTWARPTDGNSTLGGAEVAQTGQIDLDSINESLSQAQIDATRGQLVQRFPIMRHSTMRGNWAGVLSMSPDGRPLIGKIEQYDGLFTMTGDSGTCFKTAPAIGLCLSELITEGKSSTVDLTPFRPSRVDEGSLWRDEHDYDLTQQTISR